MKTSNSLLVFSFALVVAFSSCNNQCKRISKTVTNSPGSSGNGHWATAVDFSTEYNYDRQGRLMAVISGGDSIFISYTQSHVMIRSKGDNNDRTESNDLNVKGDVVISRADSFYHNYLYDTSGHLVCDCDSIIDRGARGCSFYTWKDGNKVQEEYILTDGSTKYQKIWEYYPDMAYQPTYSSLRSTGKHNRNMLKKASLRKDGKEVIREYSYEFDGNGRVTKEAVTEDGVEWQTAIEYDCP